MVHRYSTAGLQHCATLLSKGTLPLHMRTTPPAATATRPEPNAWGSRIWSSPAHSDAANVESTRPRPRRLKAERTRRLFDSNACPSFSKGLQCLFRVRMSAHFNSVPVLEFVTGSQIHCLDTVENHLADSHGRRAKSSYPGCEFLCLRLEPLERANSDAGACGRKCSCGQVLSCEKHPSNQRTNGCGARRARCLAPPITPTVSSGSPNRALSAATTKSQDRFLTRHR